MHACTYARVYCGTLLLKHFCGTSFTDKIFLFFVVFRCLALGASEGDQQAFTVSGQNVITLCSWNGLTNAHKDCADKFMKHFDTPERFDRFFFETFGQGFFYTKCFFILGTVHKAAHAKHFSMSPSLCHFSPTKVCHKKSIYRIQETFFFEEEKICQKPQNLFSGVSFKCQSIPTTLCFWGFTCF